jgi:GNAT superfamily N-acetyltransferase
MTARYGIREATGDDEPFLVEMLYAALFVAPGEPLLPRSVLDRPELARYVRGFGDRPGDVGRIAEHRVDGPVGAAWVRRFTRDAPGYGYVDDDTPELSIAVQHTRRGAGLGGLLLGHLLEEVPRCSLSVDARNPAVRLYARFGFEVASRSGTSLTMLRR